MKRIVSILCLACTVFVQAQTKAPKINFETKSHDFGEINEGDGPVTFCFKFNNIGTEPLKLHSVRASCGCTTPVWTKEPVLPSESGEVSVTYNPRNPPGAFRKSVTISSNSEPATVYLSISGKVIPRVKTIEEKYPFTLGALRAKKTHLSFFNLTKAQQKTYGVQVVNTTKSPVKVEFPNLPEHIQSQKRVVAPGEETMLEFVYDASMQPEWGYVKDDIYCWVDGAKASSYLRLSATITPDFSQLTSSQRANAPQVKLSMRKTDFGTVPRGEMVQKTITITNSGKRLLKIYAVKSTSDLVRCVIDKDELAVGESTKITVFLDTAKTRGRQYKTVNIISNAPATPNLTFTLSGAVN